MRYMLIFKEGDDKFAERENPATAGPYWGAWNDYIGALGASGIIVHGEGLHPPHTATSVRIRAGRREVQDGPFADTKESLGGFFVIEAPDLDVALDWAARSPSAAYGSVEVRPVMPTAAD